jgi:uncharacterized membrane protein
MPLWLLLICQFSILAFALLGGVFLAFSDFLMRALRKTDGASGPLVMQSINREVFRYVFIPIFLAMVGVSLVFGVAAFWYLAQPWPFMIAAVVYIVGGFGVTLSLNVPMNNALAALDPATETGRQYWSEKYLPDWTFWNTVRTVACVLASVLLLYGTTISLSS